MKNSLYAVFADVESARSAVGALLDHGAKAEDVSLIIRENYAGTFNEDNMASSTDVERSAESGITTTTGADAASGAAKGAGIGLGLGAIGAIASILVPGFGLVVGGGALAMAIGGAIGTTAAGAVAGGVTGYLKDQGVNDEDAARYSSAFDEGAAMLNVSVPTGNVDEATAKEIFGKYQRVQYWEHADTSA